MTQRGRGDFNRLQQVLGGNAEPETHVHRLGNLAGSATQSSPHLSFSSQECWADVLTEWGLLKALLDDKEKL